MNRTEVYALIDGERDYQNSRWSNLDKRNSVGDFLAYMRRYLNNAFDEINPSNNAKSLGNIRKLTAIGVAAMEKFGAPNRPHA